jgi:hypothetical protein
MELDPALFEIKEHKVLLELVKRIGEDDEKSEIEINETPTVHVDETEIPFQNTSSSSKSTSVDSLSSKLDDLLAD